MHTPPRVVCTLSADSSLAYSSTVYLSNAFTVFNHSGHKIDLNTCSKGDTLYNVTYPDGTILFGKLIVKSPIPTTKVKLVSIDDKPFNHKEEVFFDLAKGTTANVATYTLTK